MRSHNRPQNSAQKKSNKSSISDQAIELLALFDFAQEKEDRNSGIDRLLLLLLLVHPHFLSQSSVLATVGNYPNLISALL
ncbi:hypothetical protein L1987_84357 [Smallanthus sonchifolius]|uniref:Uncharacterized protein n=1 Tax=Smallanthus sonchifolius TaxID=185202 RepID=A0ACB8YF56_9ASTR|nr:hypothetical protein L1987_84357 [Smallanthus sonchifolius]